jgi:hypothetical protein
VIDNPCDPGATAARPGGMGLDNVRNRLDAMFGRDARMEAHVEAGHFRVELLLPASVDPETTKDTKG